MLQGFYNLTSGMLTQTRNLNVISNNMANVSTPGFKSDQMIATTFDEELVIRSENKAQIDGTVIGSMGSILVADRNYTSFQQGGYSMTGNSLDFALSGSGFFVLQTAEGNNVYTRNGSFSLDEDGYLSLQGLGQVLGTDGNPILLGTDQVVVNSVGNIFNESGQLLGTIAFADFENYDEQLTKTTGDVFIATGDVQTVAGDVLQGAVESSNVDSVYEMTKMMASQRTLQSGAQILTMYDQLLAKIVSDIGRV